LGFLPPCGSKYYCQLKYVAPVTGISIDVNKAYLRLVFYNNNNNHHHHVHEGLGVFPVPQSSR
jgi:hypothetical protein